MDKKQIKTSIKELLEKMGFSQAEVEIVQEDDSTIINIDIAPELSGILIGHHGEGIDALQLILNLTINKDASDWQRVSVNINDYRQAREETIKNMASRAAENAKKTGKEVVLNYLPSHERRIAHMHLDQDDQVHTYSEGEGKYRRLVIAPNLQS